VVIIEMERRKITGRPILGKWNPRIGSKRREYETNENRRNKRKKGRG
jgi:hypothetical protein